MGETVALEQAGLTIVAAPHCGGAILSIEANGRDLLRPGMLEAVRADRRAAACFPCVPYFGRLYDGLSFGGRHWRQAPTFPAIDAGHALHGEGWVSKWEVTSHTEDALTLLFRFNADEAGRFPFPYEATQTIAIESNAVRVSLTLKNTGDTPIPGGLGLHPYFARGKDMAISFNAGQYWTPPSAGARGTMGRLPDGLGSGRFAPPPSALRDHSYAGFAGAATIVGAGGGVSLVSDAPILHVYAPEGEDYLCLEPVTHLPGALTDPSGGFSGAVLSPGETATLTMTVRSAG